MTQYVDSLQPCGKFILFTFIGDIVKGTVSDTTDWGFEFQVSTNNTEQPPRWGIVHAIGEDVNVHLSADRQITRGSYILIEPLMWTEGQVYQDQKFWWTSLDKVITVQSVQSVKPTT